MFQMRALLRVVSWLVGRSVRAPKAQRCPLEAFPAAVAVTSLLGMQFHGSLP